MVNLAYTNRLRYLFSRHIPAFTRVLLVESGSQGVFERLIPRLYAIHGREMELDLITCYPDVPEGLRGRVLRVQDHSGAEARGKLYRELSAREYTVVGILCSGEPIMTKWKWMLAARLGAKVLIVNENADTLWIDWAHRSHILRLARARLGLTGSAAVPSIARILLFPLSLIYLLLYAATVHARRFLRTRLRTHTP